MKKNDHYFPTMEWIKDSKQPCGWRRLTYEGNQTFQGESVDGVPPIVEDTEMD
jgi:hypothetical protein